MFSRTAKHATLVTALVALFAGSALAAEGPVAETHPRRAEVNHRLANQDRRIHQEVKEGEMSKRKAARLHREDRQIRHEEHAMASQNGGHITKQEQRTLNQQENHVSGQIGK
ncbi:MAG: hypothetical protein JWM03_1429 [Rhodocyclales bacterium]|nr:hypothetical protein [Rhodocyclales bacterium]MDB5888557.1 hypothetical protein [Rhodocyclales bacterium]